MPKINLNSKGVPIVTKTKVAMRTNSVLWHDIETVSCEFKKYLDSLLDRAEQMSPYGRWFLTLITDRCLASPRQWIVIDVLQEIMGCVGYNETLAHDVSCQLFNVVELCRNDVRITGNPYVKSRNSKKLYRLTYSLNPSIGLIESVKRGGSRAVLRVEVSWHDRLSLLFLGDMECR